ncbi:hypothetical protein J2X65_000610 [Ancylobacter sp. 3268]|uniref:hypothetical protein n=1 Tax=Ancylobacter sp. 3268 TaxID=2817752 RepID=UPI0028661508|nr:hypothetical protein [Ancylobacter sp. 3268]MDR6951262.1 hypothetical protein [Ancylobacter sp. 3268]
MGDLFNRLARRAKGAMPVALPRHASRFEAIAAEPPAPAPPISARASSQPASEPPGAVAAPPPLRGAVSAPVPPAADVPPTPATPPPAGPAVSAAAALAPPTALASPPLPPPVAEASIPAAAFADAPAGRVPPEHRGVVAHVLHPVPEPRAPASVVPEGSASPSRVPTLVTQPPGALISPTAETAPHPAAGSSDAAPVVRVSIGSIEVRAPAIVPPPPRPASRLMTLDDYLRGDAGGRR